MAFELPKLKYAYDALEPHIDARTMEIHHTKHHNGYTTKLNAAIASFNQTLTDAEKIGSQFIQKFLPKTSTTDIINTFNTFAQNIEAIEEETKRSGTDTANTLAAAFSATAFSAFCFSTRAF